MFYINVVLQNCQMFHQMMDFLATNCRQMNYLKVRANKRLFDSNNRRFFNMLISIQSGQSQSDNINQMIQLTVIQLSAGHCILRMITLSAFYVTQQ
jgi:hypothetical protein